MNDSAIILLSGGLDSAVSLAEAKNKYTVKEGLFFDYGQKAAKYEKQAAEQLSKHYDVKLTTITLDWLKGITKTSLVNEDLSVPTLDSTGLDDVSTTENSMKNVWIPNRNALFINIAAAFCDSFGYKKIIIGANKEEAATFTDNSKEFVEKTNEMLKFSTLVHPEVEAPLINMEKEDIIRHGKNLNLPFQYIRSCYNDNAEHCGKCESCLRLKRGLERLGLFDILKLLFK